MSKDLEKHKKRIAVIDQNHNSFTYEELWEECRFFNEKIKTRCLAFILADNSIGCLIGYVGMLLNKTVPVMIKGDIDTELLWALCEKYKPEYIWCNKESVEQYFRGKRESFPEIYEKYGYTLFHTPYRKSIGLFPDLALLLTTSGSTGSPKLVRQSYKNIEANTKSIIEYLHITESERAITTLPMNYTYGLSVINTHLMAGATILLTDKSIMQKEFWQFFKEQEATSIAGVPYTYEMLDKLRFFRMDLPSLKTMTQAGGKLSPELHEKFAKYAEESGKKFVVMYGQCEATARMGYLPPEKAVEKRGSMGIAIPGGKFRPVDEAGKEIATPYTTGELIYEGDNVTLGYAECAEDLVKGDERKGVLATGDMAQFDEDGHYYIVGRKKRFLKIYGNRVNLDEMDRLIKGRFGIEAACAGVDDHLYIFITDGKYADQVRAFAADKTGLNPSAFKSIIIDEIPKNESWKTLYKELDRYYKNKPFQ